MMKKQPEKPKGPVNFSFDFNEISKKVMAKEEPKEEDD